MSVSRPLLSSAEEAEEYDLLPVASSSSHRHPSSHRRRPSHGSEGRSSILPSWLPPLHSKRAVCLLSGATFVVGLLAGKSIPNSTSLSALSPDRPEQFPSLAFSLNPYTLPGVVINRPLLPPETDVNKPYGLYDKVRWKMVPAMHTLRTGEGRLLDGRDDPDGSEADDLRFEAEFPSLFEELKIGQERGTVPDGWADWGVNKTILGIGDSLMRNNVGFFGEHISEGEVERQSIRFPDPEGIKWVDQHLMGVVDVPVVDLKLCNWFHQGMIEEPVDGFFNGESLPQNFEEKLERVFLAAKDDPRGLAGRTPDLIIFESLSWDLVLLANLARDAGDLRYEGRPFDDIELGWYRGRVAEVLALLRRTFPTTKIILQTPHIGAKAQIHVFSPIRKFQQAQAIASIALETGVELFDWGRIVSSLSNELVDGLHFRAGAATWIWGEMILYYLRRAHLHPTSPPPSPPPRKDRITQQQMIDSYSTERKIVYPLPSVLDRRDLDEAMDLLM